MFLSLVRDGGLLIKYPALFSVYPSSIKSLHQPTSWFWTPIFSSSSQPSISRYSWASNFLKSKTAKDWHSKKLISFYSQKKKKSAVYYHHNFISQVRKKSYIKESYGKKINSFMKNSLLCPDLTWAWKHLSTHQGQEPPCRGLSYGCVVRAEGEAGTGEFSSLMSVFIMGMSGVPGCVCVCVSLCVCVCVYCPGGSWGEGSLLL